MGDERVSRPDRIDVVNRSFAGQAKGFEAGTLNFTRRDWLDALVRTVAPAPTDSLLEVAAGTCAVSRAFAPHVAVGVCLDATPEMLAVGRAAALSEGARNLVFVRGLAEGLPFLDGSFDLVACRLAFHHLPDPAAAFAEMVRVCAPRGRVVLVDVRAPEGGLRARRDELERLRDPSHARYLSQEEMEGLFSSAELAVEHEDVVPMPTNLESWMDLTHTPDDVRARIRALMEAELAGGERTGFAPYRTERGIAFDHDWVTLVGRKGEAA